MTHWRRARAALARSRRARIGLLALATIALAALFADLLAGDAPLLAWGPGGLRVLPGVVASDEYRGLDGAQIAERHARDAAIWPLFRSGPERPAAVGPEAPASWGHPLGTDLQGRDVLARVLHGSRQALGFGLLVVMASLALGGGLGALAGYRGGIWNELLARPVEIAQAFPQVVVVAVVRALAPDAGIVPLVVAVAAFRWADVARLVRAEVAALGEEDFVVAARALGCSRRRIVLRHMLPHLAPALGASATFSLGSLVLFEVAVSFLGLGPAGSWGTLLADGLLGRAPLQGAVAAGTLLALTVGSLQLIAEVLAAVADARGARLTASRATR